MGGKLEGEGVLPEEEEDPHTSVSGVESRGMGAPLLVAAQEPSAFRPFF